MSWKTHSTRSESWLGESQQRFRKRRKTRETNETMGSYSKREKFNDHLASVSLPVGQSEQDYNHVSQVVEKDHSSDSPERTTSGSRLSSSVISPFVFFLALVLISPVVKSDLVGGVITVPLVLDRVDKPYLIREDVIVAESGELLIKPGVQLLFSPTVGITVFGRLIAEVNYQTNIFLKYIINLLCAYLCKCTDATLKVIDRLFKS